MVLAVLRSRNVLTLTITKGFDCEEISFRVFRRSNLWHKALKHLVTVVGGVVHQDLIPDEKQPHTFTSQLAQHTDTRLTT